MANRNEKVNIVIGAKDRTKGILGNVKNQIVNIGAAYLGWRVATDIIGKSIRMATDYEATLKSLGAVATSTGRDINQVYIEMEKQLGGVANKAQVAEGYLKGLTTELTVRQITKLTNAVKDASFAMGEDFGVQLPMIIKAIKQLNPAILDNIGVTVRLDQVNQRIRDGYYGMGTEINEFTQQNAILNEVLKQTAKFRGQEAAILETNKGAYMRFKATLDNVMISFGETATAGSQWVDILNWMGKAVAWFGGVVAGYIGNLPALFSAGVQSVKSFGTVLTSWFSDLGAIVSDFGELLWSAMTLDLDGMRTHWAQMMGHVGQAMANMQLNLDEFGLDLNAWFMQVGLTISNSIIAGFEGVQDATTKAADYAGELWKDMQDRALQDQSDWLDDTEDNYSLAAVGMADVAWRMNDQMKAAMGEFAGTFASTLGDMIRGAENTWDRIADSFIKLVLDIILANIAPGSAFVTSFLGAFKFWDIKANDDALVREGNRASMFIQKGLMAGMNGFNPTPAVAMAGVPAAPTQGRAVTQNFHFHGITNETYLRREALPVIQRASREGRSGMAVNKLNLTGGPDGVFV